jgi:hypothetical protein
MGTTRRILSCIFVACFFGPSVTFVIAQGSYRAQVRGVVSDATGAVVANATVTIVDEGTSIASTARTDSKGE